MAPSNITFLTQSHKAIAAKKRAKRDQIKEILFDDDARREFLTGFHKRKLAKADAARKKAIERAKQEHLEARREQRRMLRERAIENAEQVEKAYGAILDNAIHDEDDDDDDEWVGVSESSKKGKGKQKDAEYEDEEMLATVTVVEDFDPDSFIHGPRITAAETKAAAPTTTATAVLPPARVKPKRDAKKKTKAKKVRYETKEARKVEKTKQRARRTEKAELAGGKAGRGKGPGGGRSKAKGKGAGRR